MQSRGKFEARNSKSETNSNDKMIKGSKSGRFEFLSFELLDLFVISDL